jgi:DNA transformation protein
VAISPEYREYVFELLASFGRVQVRPMFGGAGLFRDGLMFGLITRRDILYFKTDDKNRSEYEAAGMGPFMPYENRPSVMPYHEVPAHLLEDAEEIVEWAGRAFAAALRAKDRKPSKRKPRQRKAVT